MKQDNLVRLPGDGCRHYHTGRCLYEEHRNPGYDAGLRCRVVSRWTQGLDDFYDRAEAMQVPEDRLAGLWGVRFEKMLPEMRACEDFVMADHPGLCARLHGLLCLAALPPCPGRCSRYEAEPPAGPATASDTNNFS